MKSVQHTLLFLLLFHISLPIYGQIEWLEDYLQEYEGVIDISEWRNEIEQMVNNPRNINTITLEELSILPFLNREEIDQLLKYREDYGTIYTDKELELVLPLDKVTLLKHIIYIAPTLSRKKFSEAWERKKQMVATRYKRSWTDVSGGDYEGDLNDYMVRYSLTVPEKLTLHMVGQKDPGESFASGSNQSGFDLLTLSLQWEQNHKAIKRIVLGDYKLSFGQGLLMWQEYDIGITNNVAANIKQAKKLRTSSSSAEYDYLRGVALQWDYKNLSSYLFTSHQKIDATVTDNTFSTYRKNGLHRTKSELNGEDQVAESLAGVHTEYTLQKLQAGYTFFTIYHDIPYFVKERYSPIQFFTNHSINWTYRPWKNTLLVGEVALDRHQNTALIGGASLQLNRQVQLLLLYRYYSPYFYSHYSKGLSEGNQQNEQGIYLGLNILLAPYWTLKMYVDRYNHPQATNNFPLPNQYGYKLQTLLLFEKKKYTLYWRYEYKNEKVLQRERLRATFEQGGNNRLHATLHVSDRVRYSLRAESKYYLYLNDLQISYLSYFDVNWKLPHHNISLNSRIAYHNSPHYRTTLYVYENNLPYTSTQAILTEIGWKYFANISFQTQKVKWWIRYSMHWKEIPEHAIGIAMKWKL